MPQLPEYLKTLDQMLIDLPLESEAMLLSELDGFLAGVLMCPDLIMPGQWLPVVWGGGDTMPDLQDLQHAQKLIDLIMTHYNTLVSDLQNEQFQPLYDVDSRNGDLLWEMWIGGFNLAMQMRPESWQAIHADGDEEAVAAFETLLALTQYSRSIEAVDLQPDDINQLIARAPDLIPHCVNTLHNWRIRQQSPSSGSGTQPSFGKVGRNEPCPCGSGKKYKKCCGLN